MNAELLGFDHGANLAHRAIELILTVDDHIIEIRNRIHFVHGIAQAAIHFILVFGTPPAQSGAKFVDAGGRKKNENGLRRKFLDRRRTLDIDSQNDIAPAGVGLPHLGAGNALVMAVDLGPFEQFLACNHGPKTLLIDEMVIVAIAFSWAHGAAGGCHDEVEWKPVFAHSHQHGILADTRRPRNDNQQRRCRLALQNRIERSSVHGAVPSCYTSQTMYFDTLTLAAIVGELQATVIEGRIQRVVRPTPVSIGLEIYNRGQRQHLLLSAHPQFARAHLLSARPSRGVEGESPLLLLLRKYVLGGRIIKLEQPDLERVLLISIVKGPQTRNTDDPEAEPLDEDVIEPLRCELVIEVMDRRSNIILVNDDNIVMECVRHVPPAVSRRPMQPREPYDLPPRQEKLDPRRVTAEGLQTLAGQTKEVDFARALVAAYAGVAPQLAREIVFRVTGAVKIAPTADLPFGGIATTLRSLLTDPAQPTLAFDAERQPLAYAPYLITQLTGAEAQPTMSKAVEAFYAAREQLTSHAQRRDLLTKALHEQRERLARQQHQLAEQMTLAQSLDRLRWEGEMIYAFLHTIQPRQALLEIEGTPITLDPARSAVENAQSRFRAYDKAKGALANVPELLQATEARLAGLDERLALLALADSFDQIEEIAREAEQQGYLKAVVGRKRTASRRQPPLRIISSDGVAIYVGRSASQNEHVTFTLAAPDDLWLHARSIPGAHVVIKAREVPDTTLHQAAMLAAYYSSGRGNNQVEVDIARRRHVKRVPGGPQGLVTCRAERTVRVTPTLPV